MDKASENILQGGDVTFDPPPPKPLRSVGVMFRITKPQKAILRKAAKAYKVSMVDLLYPVVDAAIERYEKELEAKASS